MLDVVFFDLDDTLVDHSGAADVAVSAWASEHGIVGEGVQKCWAEVSDEHYSRYQRREMTFAEQRRARVRQFLGRQDAGDAELDRLFEGYLRRYEAAWSPFPDAVPALRRARAAGLVVAVFTSGDRAHQEHKLSVLGLLGEVDALVTTSQLPAGKPDRGAFEHALQRTGHRAERALMVGNSLEKDVMGALRWGWRAVLVDRRGLHGDERVPRVESLDGLDFGSGK